MLFARHHQRRNESLHHRMINAYTKRGRNFDWLFRDVLAERRLSFLASPRAKYSYSNSEVLNSWSASSAKSVSSFWRCHSCFGFALKILRLRISVPSLSESHFYFQCAENIWPASPSSSGENDIKNGDSINTLVNRDISTHEYRPVGSAHFRASAESVQQLGVRLAGSRGRKEWCTIWPAHRAA